MTKARISEIAVNTRVGIAVQRGIDPLEVERVDQGVANTQIAEKGIASIEDQPSHTGRATVGKFGTINPMGRWKVVSIQPARGITFMTQIDFSGLEGFP